MVSRPILLKWIPSETQRNELEISDFDISNIISLAFYLYPLSPVSVYIYIHRYNYLAFWVVFKLKLMAKTITESQKDYGYREQKQKSSWHLQPNSFLERLYQFTLPLKVYECLFHHILISNESLTKIFYYFGRLKKKGNTLIILG